MKNSIQKKHIAMIVATVGLITIYYIGSVVVYLDKKENAIRSEIIEIKAEVDSWRQQVGSIKVPLKPGATGKEVVLLQKMLAQDGDIYPEKKITGYYGDSTKEAVKQFQKTHNLPQTGIVGTTTKNNINAIAAAHLCPEQVTLYPNFLLRKMTQTAPPLPEDYTPPMLEEISGKVKTPHKVCVRADVTPYIEHMFQEAAKDGVYLAVTAGYRKYKMQKYLYTYGYKKYGDKVGGVIAKPGKSEHQLGTAIDITDASINDAVASHHFANSDGGVWMQNNAHKYGFVMSYPEGGEEITGHHYEPWHWRFVGAGIAKELHRRGKIFNTTSTHTQTKPLPKDEGGERLTLSAGAALAVLIDTGRDEEYVLTQKNSNARIPIASITKLMTAIVASEELQPDETIVINWDAMDSKGVSGKFFAGETIALKDALHAILIESNNEIATTLAKKVGIKDFIKKMNDRAEELDMHDTHFVNVTGLDPAPESETMNYATATDVAKLLRYVFENKKDVFTITTKQKHTITTHNTRRSVPIQNTNKLLNNEEVEMRVLGGKTGTTPKAKSNLTTITETPSQQGYIITVILNTHNAAADTKDVLHYLKKVFIW